MTLLLVATSDLHHRRPRASASLSRSHHHQNQSEQHLALPNGGGEDDNHNHGKHCDNNNDDDESCKWKNKKHRRRRSKRFDNDNDEDNAVSFFKLFLQTGATLAVICFLVWNTYRHYYPFVVDDVTVSTFDDDDFNMDGAAADQQQQQQPDAVKSNTAIIGGGGSGGRVGTDFVTAQEYTMVQRPLPEKPEAIVRIKDAPPPVEAATIPPLPVWNLTASIVDYDAFGIAQRHAPTALGSSTTSNGDHVARFWWAAHELRREFAQLYGGENAARAMLERGMSTFGSVPETTTTTTTTTTDGNSDSSSNIPTDLMHTACRIQRAHEQERPFSLAFGGYSVTAGRGNYFAQSFPLVMEKQLQDVFELLLGRPLQVRNAAIGGCPSFPYGWCMNNFWGGNQPPIVDVVSWDFSMNEQGPDGLEAYIRHVLMLPNQPKLIVKDTHMATERRQVLRNYVRLANAHDEQKDDQVLLKLHDPVVLHTDPATDPFLQILPEEHRPIGFREWRKFGGPPGSPGQALHHPAVKEHEMLAWMLTMHFLAALQLVAASMTTNSNAAKTIKLNCPEPHGSHQGGFLPRPFVDQGVNSTKPWASIMYGHPVQHDISLNSSSTQSQLWSMNPVYCRTSFEPIVTGDLQNIVAWGGVAEDIDVMLPKSKMYYNRGWVLDLSESEKKAKRNLKVHGDGFGFIDSKKAYFGLYTSNVLSLFLPYQHQQRQEEELNHLLPKIGDKAFDWFQSVLICQVNEKDRPTGACDLSKEEDVQVVVGGVNTTGVAMDAVGTRYLGKQLCRYLPVLNHTSATLTSRKLLVQQAQGNVTQKYIFPEDEADSDIPADKDETAVGLAVELRVVNQHIVQRELACSVSHVVWEQQQLQPPPPRHVKQLQQDTVRVE
jgi:hypothetical protein